MKDQLISFNTAKLAKEKGFNWINDNTICGGYNGKKCEKNIVFTPTQSLLQKWLREVHMLHIDVYSQSNVFWRFNIWHLANKHSITDNSTHIRDYNKTPYISYEGALEDGLLEGLKLIK